MANRHIFEDFDNGWSCRGQFYVQHDTAGLNPKRTVGFGYATLDGKRQFLSISLEMNEALGKVRINDKITVNLYGLLIFYISDKGECWCRGIPVPCFTSGQDLIFAMVNEHLPNRERADRMFSHGIRKKAKGINLSKIEDGFLMHLGMKMVESGQDFETKGFHISDVKKMFESFIATNSEQLYKLGTDVARIDAHVVANSEQLSKTGTDLAKVMTNTGADVIKRLSAQATPNAQTTQDVRAELYGVETRTIRRWDKGQGRPQGYDPNASLETMRVNGERYRHAEKANKAARELRKRKR